MRVTSQFVGLVLHSLGSWVGVEHGYLNRTVASQIAHLMD